MDFTIQINATRVRFSIIDSKESHVKITKLAMTCDFQQCRILTSVDSDEPVQPPFNDVQSIA